VLLVQPQPPLLGSGTGLPNHAEIGHLHEPIVTDEFVLHLFSISKHLTEVGSPFLSADFFHNTESCC
jgi:hypothetical protein